MSERVQPCYAERKPTFRLVSKMTDDERATLILASRRNRPREKDRAQIAALRKIARETGGRPL